jgi:hypothetical protein
MAATRRLGNGPYPGPPLHHQPYCIFHGVLGASRLECTQRCRDTLPAHATRTPLRLRRTRYNTLSLLREKKGRLMKSPDIISQVKSRRIRWAGHVARMGVGRNVYRVLVGKPEGRRPLGRPRRRWKDGIKMDLREIGWGGGGGVDSAGLGYGPFQGCCECGDEPSGCGAK